MNNYKSILVPIITIIGEVLISILLFTAFSKWNDMYLSQTRIVLALVYFIIVYNSGVILYKRNAHSFQILSKVFHNIIIYGVAILLIGYLREFDMLPLGAEGLYLLSLFVISSMFRLALFKGVKLYRSSEAHIHRVVFVGSTANMEALYNEMTEIPSLGYKVEGYFDFAPNDSFPAECKYLGKPSDVNDYLAAHRDIHELYCALPSKEKDTIIPIIHYCVNNLVHFFSVPNVTNYVHHRMYFHVLGNVPYMSLFRDPLTKVENRLAKRTFDIVFSLLFLCTLFPIIFIVVAIITKLTMPGPIFFRQKRNGLNDREFYCLKFRSMKVNADADRVQATKDDPRKTRWGNIMRKTNIDELPQFINVLLGDMSIVGPRPHMVMHTEEYSKLINMYMVRHFVKPGITGWSQVTGFRGETKELSQMEGRIKGDIWYIEHWSMMLDIYIIIKTITNAFHGDKQAY